MHPIYNEYITFLRDTSGEKLLDLQEGYFWLDRQIIKGFDAEGNIHKFYRVKVSDDLEKVEVVKGKDYVCIQDYELKSWADLVNDNLEHLKDIETTTLNSIAEAMNTHQNYIPIIPVSMGKDSIVTCHLVRQLFPDTKVIFNNTTLDCADVYKEAIKFDNCEIMSPKQGFYQYIKEVNVLPTRFVRFCCSMFKSGVMKDRLDKKQEHIIFMGMRNEESATRSNYEDYVQIPEWGKTNWIAFLPIRTWTEMDVWLYILWRNLQVNPKYKKGYQRVGCAIACPYYTKSTWILDKYWYTKMYDRWRNILRERFISTQKWAIMNCTVDEFVLYAWNGGVFRDEPTEEVIQEFCKYTGIDRSVADQYFNKQCCECKKRINKKEVISMNLKMHGRQINKFYCKKCLMKEYDWAKEDWDNQIEMFKQQGCALF